MTEHILVTKFMKRSLGQVLAKFFTWIKSKLMRSVCERGREREGEGGR